MCTFSASSDLGTGQTNEFRKACALHIDCIDTKPDYSDEQMAEHTQAYLDIRESVGQRIRISDYERSCRYVVCWSAEILLPGILIILYAPCKVASGLQGTALRYFVRIVSLMMRMASCRIGFISPIFTLGCTAFANRMMMRSCMGSTMSIVPVNPVWPNEAVESSPG